MGIEGASWKEGVGVNGKNIIKINILEILQILKLDGTGVT
jgi:hypothetical protein